MNLKHSVAAIMFCAGCSYKSRTKVPEYVLSQANAVRQSPIFRPRKIHYHIIQVQILFLANPAPQSSRLNNN